MSNTVFSVSLDALHLAKIEEIMKTFPNESRNAVIKRCINVMHSKKDLQKEIEELSTLVKYLQNELKETSIRLKNVNNIRAKETRYR